MTARKLFFPQENSPPPPCHAVPPVPTMSYAIHPYPQVQQPQTKARPRARRGSRRGAARPPSHHPRTRARGAGAPRPAQGARALGPRARPPRGPTCAIRPRGLLTLRSPLPLPLGAVHLIRAHHRGRSRDHLAIPGPLRARPPSAPDPGVRLPFSLGRGPGRGRGREGGGVRVTV